MPQRFFLVCFLVALFALAVQAEDPAKLKADAKENLHRAVAFFRQEVAVEGGYLWRYSSDLVRREGEGKATDTTAWVQPPGTPSVGNAFLNVYRQTKDKYYLEAAIECARALVKGQLQSGGWDYRIEFYPKSRSKYAYRMDGATNGHNVTTLDDNTTQAALRFLIQVDKILRFQEASIHEAVLYGLSALIKAQYSNGAWPQRYSNFPDPAQFPVKPASYPESWPREFAKKDYVGYYTLNDNTLVDTINLMFFAEEIYGGGHYRAAALRGMEFILLAQMPDPQPAWAQHIRCGHAPRVGAQV